MFMATCRDGHWHVPSFTTERWCRPGSGTLPRLGYRWPAHEVVGEHRPPAHLVVFVFIVQRPPAVPRCHGQALRSLVLPEPGPPAFPVLPVPLLPLSLQRGCAGRLGDVGQGDTTAAPPGRAAVGETVLSEHAEGSRHCRRGQPGRPGHFGTAYRVRIKNLVHQPGRAAEDEKGRVNRLDSARPPTSPPD